MSDLFKEDRNREIIGDFLIFCGCGLAIITGILAVIMPDSILADDVLINGQPWAFWTIPFSIGVILAMAGIALMAWNDG